MHELFFIFTRYLKLQYIFQFDGVELWLKIVEFLIRKPSTSELSTHESYLETIFDVRKLNRYRTNWIMH